MKITPEIEKEIQRIIEILLLRDKEYREKCLREYAKTGHLCDPYYKPYWYEEISKEKLIEIYRAHIIYQMEINEILKVPDDKKDDPVRAIYKHF